MNPEKIEKMFDDIDHFNRILKNFWTNIRKQKFNDSEGRKFSKNKCDGKNNQYA